MMLKSSLMGATWVVACCVALSAGAATSDIAPLALGTAAVTPLADRDGTGWTGEGETDLRMLPAGPLVAAEVPFEISSKAAVLSGDQNLPRQREAVIPAAGKQGACLYLLHTLKGAPRGETLAGAIHLNYQDGTTGTVDVKSGRDVAPWRNPLYRVPNGILSWTGDNPFSFVGLYVSRFPIEKKPLKTITLEAAPNMVWMVVGAALGKDIPLPPITPDGIKESARWRAIDSGWEVEPGSALDLSALNAGPVPGRLVAQGPHLVVEGQPDRPVRLMGANLCFDANYPDHSTAERLAKAMRQMGYNAVRFHHHDHALAKWEGDRTELNPDKLDRLDFLMAQCKAQGLWFTTDVSVSRHMPKGVFPELDAREGETFGSLVPILPAAQENWKKFAAAWLTHRNPYTGLTWAEDPAMASLSLVNEDTLEVHNTPLYDRAFNAWLETQPPEIRDVKVREQVRAKWTRDLQAKMYTDLRAYLHGIGVKAPITDCNYKMAWWGISVRSDYDLVDAHTYHDHPHFPGEPWALPHTFRQHSPVERMLWTPLDLTLVRALDKPFTVTEINYVFPNHHRGQYGAAVAAVAGLQDWSGIWRFDLASKSDTIAESRPIWGFDGLRDPISQLTDRALALLWRRGDVKAAPDAVAVAYDPAVTLTTKSGPPSKDFTALALVARVGNLKSSIAQTAQIPGLKCLLENQYAGKVPAGPRPVYAYDDGLAQTLRTSGVVNAKDFDPAAGRVRSPDGQFAMDAPAGMMTLITPRSVAAILPGGGSAKLGAITIYNSDKDEATFVIAALDGDLASGKRLLVLHITDAMNDGITFGGADHTLLTAWGSAKILVRAGSATINIPGKSAKAWALDLGGRRKEQHTLAAKNGGVRLAADIVQPWGVCAAWEIVRE